MKKFFSVLWNILKYLLVYVLFQLLSGIVLSFGLAIYYGVTQGPGMDMKMFQNSVSKHLYTAVAVGSAFTLLIYALMFRNKERNLWQTCNFKKISLKNSGSIILLSLGISLLSSSFIILTKDIFPSYESVSQDISIGLSSILGIVSIVILVPIFEEILFRGIIFNELRKHISLTVSIIIQGLIFAVAHWNLAQGIYTFVLGSLAALIYYWTRSIVSNILLHTTFNLMGTLVIAPIVAYTGNLIIIDIVLGIFLLFGSTRLIYKSRVNNTVIEYISEQV